MKTASGDFLSRIISIFWRKAAIEIQIQVAFVTLISTVLGLEIQFRRHFSLNKYIVEIMLQIAIGTEAIGLVVELPQTVGKRPI